MFGKQVVILRLFRVLDHTIPQLQALQQMQVSETKGSDLALTKPLHTQADAASSPRHDKETRAGCSSSGSDEWEGKLPTHPRVARAGGRQALSGVKACAKKELV